MMKDLKLIEMFKQGHMVIPLFLMQNYKKFNIKLDEFIFLMYLYNIGNNFLFKPEQLSEAFNVEIIDVMNLISSLTDKGFIKVEVVKSDKGYMEEVVMLDDFYSKVSLLIMDDVNESKEASNDTSDIFESIEREFGRTLSPIEIEIIKSWLSNNYSTDLINEALKEATFNGVSNLRYIDKILYEWSRKGIKTIKDVEENRKKRNVSKDKESDIDLDTIEWNWFDEDE